MSEYKNIKHTQIVRIQKYKTETKCQNTKIQNRHKISEYKKKKHKQNIRI